MMAGADMPGVPAALSDDDAFAVLREEFAHWQRAGRECPLWWRDDDLIADTPALRRLVEMATRNHVPVLMAVIPGRVAETLARDTASMAALSFCQHGYRHRNHEPEGAPPSEFGPARTLDAMAEDLHTGFDRMSGLFGARFLRVFAPPWNRLRPEVLPLLRQLGFVGVSQYHGEAAASDAPPRIVNAHVDILQWAARPPIACQPAALLVGRMVALLREQRAGAGPARPLGILTHHLPMLDDAWAFMQRIMDTSQAYDCVRWLPAAELFAA